MVWGSFAALAPERRIHCCLLMKPRIWFHQRFLPWSFKNTWVMQNNYSNWNKKKALWWMNQSLDLRWLTEMRCHDVKQAVNTLSLSSLPELKFCKEECPKFLHSCVKDSLPVIINTWLQLLLYSWLLGGSYSARLDNFCCLILKLGDKYAKN